jgi:3-dehydroquinate synthetase
MVESALSQSLLSADDARRIIALLEKYGFDLSSPVDDKSLLDAIKGDKKRKGNSIHAIYPTAIGCVVDRVVALDKLP